MAERIDSQLKRDYFWNTASGVMVSAAAVIMLLVVTRVSGVYLAGVFALGTAIGQQFQVLGNYEIRTYQATDVRHRFSFGTYHATRVVTVLLMVLAVIVYPVLTRESPGDLWLIIAVACLRVVDAYEDVFLGEMQRLGHLDWGGRANFWRVLLTTAVFTVTLIVTKQLGLAVMVTLAGSALLMVALVVPPSKKLFELKPLFAFTPMRQLLVAAFPLFLAIFLSLYLSNAPRFAIATYMNNEYQGYFAILFMPAFTINLLSTLLFRPLLTRLAHVWSTGDVARFQTLVSRGLLGALTASILTFVATYLLGVPLLNWLYSVQLQDFKVEMMVLVSAGALNAVSMILYYALSTMRKQHAVLIAYAAAALSALTLSSLFVSKWGMIGAAWSYFAAMVTLTLIFVAELLYFLRRG